MPVWGWILVVLALAALAVALFERVQVFEFERALKYRQGKFVSILGPGRHWLFRPTTSVRKLDVRPRFVSIPGQEVLSSDAVGLRVSLAAEYEIADPARAVNDVESFEAALYLTLQLALRAVVGGAGIEEILEKRSELGEQVMALSREPSEAIGVALRRVDLKDIMFPGQLKKTFAQVVNARQEGLAALERARGETAALRSLANAARMLEGSPALMQLRLLQQIGESGGNTIVLGLPAGGTPLPIRRGDVEPSSRPPELPPDDEL